MTGTILYYVFSCSVVLYYGVGINRLLTLKKDWKTYLKSLLKSLLITSLSTGINWLMINFVLAPLGVTELFPLITVIIFILIALLFHTLIKTTPFEISEDYAVPLVIVFISLMECSGLISSVVISISSVVCFYAFGILISALRRRFHLYGKEEGFKPVSVLLLSLGLVCIALYCWNASWITLGLNSSF